MGKENIIGQAEKHLKAGRIDRAIKEYEKLLALDPSDMRAKLKIADLYARKKDTPKAVATYREVAENYTRENFHLKSIAVYKTILKLQPSLIEVNARLGDLYHQVGLTADAVNQYYIVASYYEGKGTTKEGIEIRKKIVDLDPSNVQGRMRFAEMLQDSRKTDEAVKEYEAAIALLLKRGDHDGLIEAYEKVLYLRPDAAPLNRDLLKLYLQKKDFKKLGRRIENLPENLKRDLQVLECWAECLLEEGQIEAARRKFRDLLEAALQRENAELASKVRSRVLQAFADDEDYLKELNDLCLTAKLPLEGASPKFRQDFEKTEMVDLAGLEKLLKKK